MKVYMEIGFLFRVVLSDDFPIIFQIFGTSFREFVAILTII